MMVVQGLILSNEPEHIFDMYGPQAKVPGSYAANCLMARRLAEAGVRYVQVIDRAHPPTLDSLRDDPECADQEHARISDEGDPGLTPLLHFDPSEVSAVSLTVLGILGLFSTDRTSKTPPRQAVRVS